MGKVVDEAELARIVAQRQAAGEHAVFTNGVFDLLHVGHTRYLQRARALGDFLIIGVNSDASTRRLKGPTRPINPDAERAELLAALACVDYVTIFGDTTASRLVELLRPAVYIKGGDYSSNDPQNRACDVVLQPEELRRVLAGDTSAYPALVGLDQRLPEARVVATYGGSVALLSYLPEHSTTALIQRSQDSVS
jgi:D-beta-D-heptose 7-phosphate kinase/D-beta-D-heptose 1-phosphate adenosyltransferase